MSKLIHVAVGVIINDRQEILIAKRHQHLHQGGKWEFPGGKVEQGETVQQALIRELKEEVALNVQQTQDLMIITHDYAEKQVKLDVHWVTDFNGNAFGVEGQEIAWVAPTQLKDYRFPEANKPIIDKILQLSRSA